MKSIQTKILTLVIAVVLLVAVTTTVISVVYIRNILNTDSDTITESVANTESQKINTYLRDIEYTVNSMKKDIKKALERTLKPEFVNRIDDIVVFNTLSKEDIEKLTDFYYRGE